MNNQPSQSIQDDQINLKELWATLAKSKLTIITTTLISTIAAVGYVITATPIYQGNVLIEVGEVVNNHEIVNNYQLVNSQPTTIFNLDNINTLKEVTVATTGTNITIPNGTSNILNITMESSDKVEIQSKLNDTIQFILNRHHEKAKLYQTAEAKIRMTQVIGEIHVGDKAIKPKVGLIITVGLMTGLILGIFMVFLRELISKSRKNEED